MRNRFSFCASLVLLASAASTIGCGSDGAPPTEPAPAISAQPSPGGAPPATTMSPPPAVSPSLAVALDHPALTLRRGGSVDLTVTVTRTAFHGPVDVTLSALPGGVSTSTPSFTIAAGQTQATLHFAAAASATVGTAPIVVTAVSGTLAAHAPLALFVGDGGKLDPSFGTGGIATLQKPSAYLAPNAVAVQTDAKILVGGGYDLASHSPHVPRGGVMRFTDAGAVDTTFGNAGVGTIPALASVANMALQPDGAIVVCGPSTASDAHLVLARLATTGALDASFGTAGVVELGANVAISCSGLALDAAGKITIASSFEIDPVKYLVKTVVARFTPAGAPDVSYGDAGGIATTLFGGGSAFPTAFRLTPAGLFLGVSRAAIGTTSYEGIIAKLDLAGHVDPTFATSGAYDTKYQAFQILPLPGGAIYYALQNQYFRLTAAGALDSAFGAAGQLPNLDTSQSPFMVSTADPGGMLYRFGYDGEPFYSASMFAYRPDGSPDPGFGDAGQINLHPSLVVDGRDITISPDGRLVALGGSGETVIYIARFIL